MNSEQVAEAVLAWARASVPGLAGGYDYIPMETTQPLPDVVADVARVDVTNASAAFPMRQIQQVWLRVFTCELSFMVDNSNPDAAAAQLRSFEDLLSAQLMADGSLGGRVPLVSPYHSFDFTPPFIERPDGIRGREMTMQLTVGDPLEAPE